MKAMHLELSLRVSKIGYAMRERHNVAQAREGEAQACKHELLEAVAACELKERELAAGMN